MKLGELIGHPFGKPILFSVALVVLDAFLLNQGIISLFVALGVVFVGLPRAFLRKFAGAKRQRFARLSVYLAAVVLVFALNVMNSRIAKSRAEEIIVAVQAYRAKHQRYPARLQDLMPDHLEHIPRAKYTLWFNDFRYRAVADDPWLEYTELPPFGRPFYSFRRGAWFYMD